MALGMKTSAPARLAKRQAAQTVLPAVSTRMAVAPVAALRGAVEASFKVRLRTL